MQDFLLTFCVSVFLASSIDAAMLDTVPMPAGGSHTGVWDADSLEIDVYATPALRAAISDLNLGGFVDGQITLGETGAYRSQYIVDVDASLTFLGGPIAVAIKDTVSEVGEYAVAGNTLIFTVQGVVDTLGFSVFGDTLSLIQEVPLGDFSTLVPSIDPAGGPPLAVLRLYRLQSASADFDGDGSVGFTDFLAFAGHFGKHAADSDFDSRFDLDSNGEVGFSDFLAFISQFGS